MARRVVLLAVLACALGAGALGCGGEEGVADGATVRVYVAAPLCAEAERELTGDESEVEVEAVCLAAQGRDGRLDLATIGANARRATEDSTAVGYVEEPGRAGEFSEPVVEEAGIAWLAGARAIPRFREAIAAADTGSLRQSVSDALG